MMGVFIDQIRQQIPASSALFKVLLRMLMPLIAVPGLEHRIGKQSHFLRTEGLSFKTL